MSILFQSFISVHSLGCLRVLLILILVSCSATVSSAQLATNYPPGFTWRRAVDWTVRPATDLNTTNGNPDDDVLTGDWIPGWRISMTNLFQHYELNTGLPQAFYRAEEFSADPSVLEVRGFAVNQLDLRLYGKAGISYTLEPGSDLMARIDWSTFSTISLTNSFQFIGIPSSTNTLFIRTKTS